MKIVKRNITLLTEELIKDNLNELEALQLSEDLNNANFDDNIYYQVVLDDYIIYK